MEKIIFLEEIFFEKMWGGNHLEKFYHNQYQRKTIPLGEVWGVSGHRNGVTKIKSGNFKGKTLNDIWNNFPELFGRTHLEEKEFPFQIRLVDAKQKLSVQVHPDEAYAQKYANDHGKNEAWYILSCQDDASLIYGQTTTSKDALQEHIDNKTVLDAITTIPIKEKDFIYVPTGTVHAIGDETFLIEVAECSDTTFRFYDYERRDQEGNLRELHIDASLNVINFSSRQQKIEQSISYFVNYQHALLLDRPEFVIEKLTTQKQAKFAKNNDYYACYIISGTGTISDEQVKTGDFFLMTAAEKVVTIEGELEILLVYKKE